MSAADAALPLPESELVLESAIAPLEAAVREGGAAAGRAASRLLRAYRMYPARLNRDVVVASLAQALTALPRNDFQLALYLLPAALRGDAAIASLQERERELQSGSFVAFWAGLKDEALAGPLASAGGFETGIRQFMLGALNRVYQRIEAEELGKQLNLSAAAAADFAGKNGWTIEGTSAVAPAIADNTARPKKAFDEGLKYAEVAGLVATLSK